MIFFFQKNQRLMAIINGTIPNSKSPAPLLPDDCHLVAKAVEETLSNTDVVTSDTSVRSKLIFLLLLLSLNRSIPVMKNVDAINLFEIQAVL